MRKTLQVIGRLLLGIYEWGWILAIFIVCVVIVLGFLLLSPFLLSGILADKENDENP